MTAAPRILFVDDTAESHASALRELQRQFPNLQVTEVCDAEAFSRALDAGDFDLAIAGDPLPWTSALDVVRALKARRPGRPVILAVASTSEGTLVEAIREGLDDYVIKLQGYERRLRIAVHAALEILNHEFQRRGIVEALRQPEERFHRFLQTNPVGVTITTIDEGRFLDVNDRYLELTGCSREEIVGRTVFDLATWADPQDRVRLVEGLRARGVVRDFEARYRTRSGEIRESLASFEIIDFEGRPAILTLVNDITDRKRAEQALRESEERYRRLVEASPDGVLLHAEGRIEYINPAGMRLLGARRPEQLIGKHITDIIQPEYRGIVLERVRKLLTDDRPVPLLEEKLLRVDGSLVDVEAVATPLSVQGRAAVQVILRDITERKKAEQALRDSEEQYRSLVTNIPDVTWTCDHEGRVTFISPNIESQTGFSREEVRRGGDAHWSERTHPDDLDRVWSRYRALFETGKPYDVEYRMRRPDGSWVWLHERALKTYQRDGVWYADGVSSDVTERKEAEAERTRLFEEVRQGREQLRALSRSLVELQENERRLIARELHDEVGQLLTGLKLAIENGGRFGRSRAGQGEATTIVNDLIGRVRNLSMNLRPAMLDDLGLVPALLWHVERYTTQTGVRVEFHHAGAQRRLPSEIETAAFRIVQEALTNVARHAGVKKVKVDVRVSTDRLSVRIKDQGAGFEPEIVMAGDSSGLAGMRERVNLLQGWLTIESAPGSGTHLTAELPLAAEAAGKGANVRNHNHRARRRPPGRAAGPAGVAGI